MASPPTLKVTTCITDSEYDAVVYVATPVDSVEGKLPAQAQEALKRLAGLDATTKSKLFFIIPRSVPGERLVISPTGPLDRDYDDARRISDAAFAGVERVIKAGARKPLLLAPTSISLPGYEEPLMAAIMGALQAAYVPLEIREAFPDKSAKLDTLGIFVPDNADKWRNGVVKVAHAIECGRIVARDIGGSDPERMAAPCVAKYVEDIFGAGTSKVTYEIKSNRALLEREYPCFAAVDRAAAKVERHTGRVIWLEYKGSGKIDKTVYLVGKGITYDTGGADIKAGGVMAGMHRDKCGAATVAGFFRTLDDLRPENIKVVGGLAMCRNSVGSECYVADELITSRAGVRLRVGNTDAEGRMAMVDVLCHAKEKCLAKPADNPNPQFMTIATLTGHAIVAMGPAYTIVMENGPAKKQEMAKNIQAKGDLMADPFEISTIRREDYEFNAAPSEYEDIVQANNKPSSQTPRGHQVPAPFMIVTSGMDKHGRDSDTPLPYVHLDIAGSSGPFPGVPTGATLPALTKYFLGV